MELYLKQDRKVIKRMHNEKLCSEYLQIGIEISIVNLSKLIEHIIKYKEINRNNENLNSSWWLLLFFLFFWSEPSLDNFLKV